MKQNREKDLERLRSMDRALLREQAIEGGWYNKPKVQVHKDKKSYSRKPKHPKRYDIN